MHFVPPSFTYTPTTTEGDVAGADGILYYSGITKNTEWHARADNLQHKVAMGWAVFDQTNELFGPMYPGNDIGGFAVRAVFPDCGLSVTGHALDNAEGIKMINSIRGAMFPEWLFCRFVDGRFGGRRGLLHAPGGRPGPRPGRPHGIGREGPACAPGPRAGTGRARAYGQGPALSVLISTWRPSFATR